MPVWQWLVESAGALGLLVLLYALTLILRRRWLARNGGTFELSYRARDTVPGRGWLLGLGRYTGGELEWFRIFSLSPKPRAVWARESLSYAGKRAATRAEQVALYGGQLVVSCTTADGPVELAMSEASLTGFQSWLEAGPPGTDWDRR